MSFFAISNGANKTGMTTVPTAPVSFSLPVTTAPMPIEVNSVADAAATYQNNDPVTKAVLDNIMGKLPTKKPVVVATCDVCKLEFSGQIVMDMHLAGAKHAKKVKSQEILDQLKTTGETFTRDDKTKILKCEVCNIVVNSSQQLQTHLSGNKHKQKAMKKGSQPACANGVTTPVKSPQPTTTNGGPTGSSDVPPGVQVLPDGAGSKTKKYYCDTCNVPLNSEVQLEQHLTSRKHKDRLKPKPKRPSPYFRRPQPVYNQGPRGAGRGIKKSPLSTQYQNPLATNFISGGKISYSPEHPTSYSPTFPSLGFPNSNFAAPMQY